MCMYVLLIVGFCLMASLVTQMVKHLSAMQETWVRSLGWEDPLEKEMAPHSSTLAWRNPMDRGAWWAAVRGVTESWTQLCHYTTIIGTIGTIIILF